MNSKRVAIVAIASLALAGCAETYSQKVGKLDQAQFGEANRQTYAAMIIDPDPHYDKPMASSGEHAAQAVERYRADKVKQPKSIRTTTGTGGGGGGSGGGGGGSGG
jgi:type IV pilus biogenesis protein CpaD/CtpE